jgi:calcineurin-like phosphoesterase
VAKNDVRLQGVVIDIDTQSGRANAIERISVKLNQ